MGGRGGGQAFLGIFPKFFRFFYDGSPYLPTSIPATKDNFRDQHYSCMLRGENYLIKYWRIPRGIIWTKEVVQEDDLG